jgi:hypothetical protein
VALDRAAAGRIVMRRAWIVGESEIAGAADERDREQRDT